MTIVRFAAGIRAERTLTVNSEADLTAIRDFVTADDFADGTAIWSALDHGPSVAASAVRAESNRPVPVVLMTDGENNAGESLDNFLQRQRELPEASKVHVFAIRVGEADPAQLDRAARATGGRMVEAQAGSLQEAFKEIRGCH